jgi:hypothetical protein
MICVIRSYWDFAISYFYVMIVYCILVTTHERIVSSFRNSICYINQHYVWIGADCPLQTPNPWRGEQKTNKNFMHFRFATKLLNWHSVAECLWRRQWLVAQLVWTKLRHFIPPYPIWRSSVMLSSHQPWQSLSFRFASRCYLPTTLLFRACYMPRPFFSSFVWPSSCSAVFVSARITFQHWLQCPYVS